MHQREAVLDLIAAVLCSLAIASVPVFSYQEGLSFIPQIFALVALVAVGAKVLIRYPKGLRMHPGMIAYTALVCFFGLSLLWENVSWGSYLTGLKVLGMALAAHFSFRTPRALVILFGTYCLASIVTVSVNWSDLQHMQYAFDAGMLKGQRFSGTFGNANTAALYGVMVCLSALIAFAGARFKLKWVLGAAGIASGLLLVYFSGSRKGMMGILVLATLTPVLVLRLKKVKLLSLAKFALLIPVLIFAAWSLITALPNSERLLKLMDEGVETDGSTRERYSMIAEAIHLWSQNPVLGTGYDGFARYGSYGVYSHSTFAEILCNAGIIGIFLILIFYLAPIWSLSKIIFNTNFAELRSLHVGLIAFWVLFMMFSVFAVLFEARDFIPMGAAIGGYLVAVKGKRSSAMVKQHRRRVYTESTSQLKKAL